MCDEKKKRLQKNNSSCNVKQDQLWDVSTAAGEEQQLQVQSRKRDEQKQLAQVQI
jgi:hypothetical protein